MIKLFCFDFDGVFTNGKIIIDNENVIKNYNVKDGAGIKLLKKLNIKTGIISAFRYKKTNVKDICQHLDIDYFSEGKSDKLSILKDWINEMNIDINEVAYIGDDLSDISILASVGISGCPNDAVESVKIVSNFICKNKGGDGCVREFIEYVLNHNMKDISIEQHIKQEAIYQLNNFPNIEDIVDLIKNSKGNIYFTGIGKSQNIANHCANLLKCIGINCFFLDATNSLHGDIGTISKPDIVFLFSKSGNTNELETLLKFLKSRCYTVGICCNYSNQIFNSSCNQTVILPFNNEIKGNINTIPTNSYMSQMFFCNILVSKLSHILSLDLYKKNHPAGNIGLNLKTIKDVIIHNFPKILFKDNIDLHNILLEMTRYKIGCCFFISNLENNFIGLLTDGDIRRLLVKNKNLLQINESFINKNYMFETDISKKLNEINLYYKKKAKFLPILIKSKLYGIIDTRSF